LKSRLPRRRTRLQEGGRARARQASPSAICGHGFSLRAPRS